MEQKRFEDSVKSPVIPESQTCTGLHDKSTGLYLYGDLYVADEFMREKEYEM